MKRARAAAGVCDREQSKKRTAVIGMFQKWKRELDKDHQTMTWLECEATTNSESEEELCGALLLDDWDELLSNSD